MTLPEGLPEQVASAIAKIPDDQIEGARKWAAEYHRQINSESPAPAPADVATEYAALQLDYEELRRWAGKAFDCINFGVRLMPRSVFGGWEGVRGVLETAPWDIEEMAAEPALAEGWREKLSNEINEFLMIHRVVGISANEIMELVNKHNPPPPAAGVEND